MTDIIQDVFLRLLRVGIGHANPDSVLLPDAVDWAALKDLAEKQGLSAVILDGIESVKGCGISLGLTDKAFMMQWIGEVLNEYEYFYDLCGRTIAQMAGFYNKYGFKMMVLKGYACSLNWPRPEHRPVGDIDIWQFGKQKEADALIASKLKIEIDSSHHHHTVFQWGDFTVENHYDFINVYSRKSNRELEKTFKSLGQDDTHSIELYGKKVYLPSPNLHSLFLIRHLAAHFTSTNIMLRQLLDWAFFAEKHSLEIDWKWLISTIEKYQMKDFFDCLNAICVEDLGFDASVFPKFQVDPSIKEMILADIIDPAFGDEEHKHLIPRVLYKFRRWKANSWKRRFCYKESDWKMFWGSVWAHILKPRSI